jgi:hypothetical protein
LTLIWKDLDGVGKAEMVKLAWKPHYSASKIAETLSQQLQHTLSRNTVMGVYDRNPMMRKTHPLGGAGAEAQRRHREARAKLTPEEKQAKREAKAQERKEREAERQRKRRERTDVIYLVPDAPRPPTPMQIRESAVAYDEASLRLPLEELEARQCRWPVNTPEPKVEPYLFCGHRAKPGKRYCPHHVQRSVIPITLRRKPRV